MLENIAHYISMFSLAYSFVLIIITLRFRIHPSLTYLVLAVLCLSFLPNNWFVNAKTLELQLLCINIKYVFFNTSMILLGRAFILIGLNKKIIYGCMVPFIFFGTVTILSAIFNFDFLIVREANSLHLSPLYNYFFFPTLALTFFVVLANLIIRMNHEQKFNKKLIRLLVAGISFLIFFGLLDMLYYIIFSAQINIANLFFNISAFGILVFNIYVLYFISEIFYNNLMKKKNFSLQPHKTRTDEISEKNLKKIYERAVRLIEDSKLYTDPDLDLQILANTLGVTRNELSRSINIHSGQHFTAFLNSFRIERLESMLKDPSLKGSTILTLSYQAGFNSKATVNRVFKLYTGLSPHEFRTMYMDTSKN